MSETSYPVAKINTGDTSRANWYYKRAKLLVNQLQNRGYAWESINRLAQNAMAQFWRETGKGLKEWNYNVGNAKKAGKARVSPDALGWHGGYITLTDPAGSSDEYLAFDSLEDAIADYVTRMETSSRYSHAWWMLAAGLYTPFQWFEDITRHGYSGHTLSAWQNHAALTEKTKFDIYL